NFILEAPFILRIDKSGWKRSLALIIQGVVSVSCAEEAFIELSCSLN
ncbi:hypothetical protein Golax_011221, partial [Gossypium laxum]|nr:hypothetical protein [Gossypium laxum]